MKMLGHEHTRTLSNVPRAHLLSYGSRFGADRPDADCPDAASACAASDITSTRTTPTRATSARIAFLAIAAALLVALTLALTGCAAQDKAASNKEHQFIFVCPITENAYWQECIDGIEDADKAFGVQTKIIGPQTAQHFLEELPGFMQQAIDEKPDGIFVYAGPSEVASLINTATEQDIPVITIDADAPDTSRLAYVGTDLYAMGYSCGEALVELTDGNAKVAYMCTSTDMENETRVYSAFKDATYDYYMDIVAEAEGGNTAEKAAAETKKMLAAHPDITAFFATGGDNVAGIAQALKDLGKEDLIVIGLEDTEANLNYLREGVIDLLVAQSPYQMGYQSVKALAQHLDNDTSVKGFISTPTIQITQDNVDSYKN